MEKNKITWKSPDNNFWNWFMVVGILTYGDPDLLEAIIHFLMK